MQYMGSKIRIAKHILPIMLAGRFPGQWWVEPFVGGGNMIDKVTGNRIGADLNPYLIEALVAIRDRVEDLPKNNEEFTEDDYRRLRVNDDYEFKGYAGFAFSFGAKWLGGWARDPKGGADFVSRGYRAAVRQSPKLKNVKLVASPYQNLEIPDNSLIYCDPPYAGTTGYKDKFDSAPFYEWCREKTREGHTVFVSEYSAPEDFDCVWSKQVSCGLDDKNADKRVEKLFTWTDYDNL